MNRPPSDSSAGPRGRHAGRTVLLIEDDDAVRASLERLLTSEGLRVIAANGGTAALAHLSNDAIDLMITDLRMSPIDGWDLLFHYRIERPTLPIFVVTALPPQASGGAHRLATEFFQKPLDCDELVKVTRFHLDLAEERAGAGRGRTA